MCSTALRVDNSRVKHSDAGRRKRMRLGVGEALGYVFDSRRYSFIALISGLVFATYQLFSSGTIYYDPNPQTNANVAQFLTYPSVGAYQSVYILGFPVPSYLVTLTPQLTLFLAPQVLILIATESLLVAANSALSLFVFNQARCETGPRGRRGAFNLLTSVVPMASMLGCCGGAFLAVLVGLGATLGVAGSVGLSPSRSLTPTNELLALVPSVVLYANLLYMSRRVSSNYVVNRSELKG